MRDTETAKSWAKLVKEKLKKMLWRTEYAELLDSLNAKTCDEDEANALVSLIFTMLMEVPEASYQTLILEMEETLNAR